MRRNLRDFVEQAALEPQYRALIRESIGSIETETKVYAGSSVVADGIPLHVFYLLSAQYYHAGWNPLGIILGKIIARKVFRAVEEWEPEHMEERTLEKLIRLGIIGEHRLLPKRNTQTLQQYTLECSWNPPEPKESFWGIPNLFPGYNSYRFWTMASRSGGFPGFSFLPPELMVLAAPALDWALLHSYKNIVETLISP